MIKLFGSMCGHHGESILLSALDKEGVSDHLDMLMDDMDLTLKDKKGLDTLNFLANNIVVNAQCYTDWSGNSSHTACERTRDKQKERTCCELGGSLNLLLCGALLSGFW